MNQHIYRFYQTNFYPFLRSILPLIIILYLPLVYNYRYPSQWGFGSGLFIAAIGYFGYIALGDIYRNKFKWFIIDSSLFGIFYFYLWFNLQ